MLYSNDRRLIGQQAAQTPLLAAAFAGRAHSHITDLQDAEHETERERWPRLIETYVPVHRAGSTQVLAVAEFY